MDEGTPRWVKVFGIVGVVVVLALVVLLLVGGHGPGRHLPGDGTSRVGPPGAHTAPEHG